MPSALILTIATALLGAAGADTHPDARGAVVRTFPAGEPQFFVDDHFVDNRFNEDSISAKVVQKAMPGKRTEMPLMAPDADKPWELSAGVGYISVVFDPRVQRFRLYYQVWNPKGEVGGLPTYVTCYAESADGLHWEKPLFDLVPFEGRDSNILMIGDGEAKAPTVHLAETAGEMADGTPVRNLGMLPETALRGNSYLMYYCDSGHYLATSDDGLAWNQKQEKIIPNRVDCFMTLVHDDVRDEYCMFYRNKLIYHDSKDPLLRGNTRMMARIASEELWTLWDGMPTTVLLPDEADHGRFYNMPVFKYGGVYWGFLEQFNEDPELIEVELAFSRDGFDWERLPSRPRLIPVGEDGAWDDGMTFAADRVIEVGDEWWLYYSAYNGYHDEKDRIGKLGLVRFGKERFVGIKSDPDGKTSYVVTRPLVWPGGDLVINANAAGGSMKVRVTDLDRNVLNGLTWEACAALEEDKTRHTMTWDGGSMAGLEGKLVRLEFEFEDADLFAFLADEDGQNRIPPVAQAKESHSADTNEIQKRKGIMSKPMVEFTDEERLLLRDHRIALFGNKIILDSRSPITDEQLAEIKEKADGNISPELLALWKISFGGSLDYDYEVYFDGHLYAASLRELFFPGSAHYRDLNGWIDHEIELLQEIAVENGETVPERTPFIPFGGFEYLERFYVSLLPEEYGSVLAYAQGIPWKGRLNEDSVAVVASSVIDLFDHLSLDEDPFDELSDEYASGKDMVEQIRKIEADHPKLAQKLKDVVRSSILDWRPIIEHANFSTVLSATESKALRLALEFAVSRQDETLVDYLHEKAAPFNIALRGTGGVLHFAMSTKAFGIVNRLLELNVVLGSSPVIHAAGCPDDLLLKLLDHGVQFDEEAIYSAAETGATNGAIALAHSDQIVESKAIGKIIGSALERAVRNDSDAVRVETGELGSYLTADQYREHARLLREFAERLRSSA